MPAFVTHNTTPLDLAWHMFLLQAGCGCPCCQARPIVHPQWRLAKRKCWPNPHSSRLLSTHCAASYRPPSALRLPLARATLHQHNLI